MWHSSLLTAEFDSVLAKRRQACSVDFKHLGAVLPCALGPVVEEVGTRWQISFDVYKVNVDDEADSLNSLASSPSLLILFKNGEPVHNHGWATSC